MQALIALPSFVALCIAAFFFGDFNRQLFGDYYGNIAAIAQLAVVAALVLAARAACFGKRRLALLITGYATAALRALLAWFTHPNQVLDRAYNRADEYRHALEDLQQAVRAGIQAPPEAATYARIRAEIRARDLELEAALHRFNEPTHVQEARVPPYLLALLSAAFFVCTASGQWFTRRTPTVA